MNRPGLILGVDRIQDQVALASRAEAAGFGSVWTTEFHNRNGLVRLAAVAAATSHVKVGTGIAYAYMRAPALNAAAAMDVDEISGGRMILGLGSGTRSMNEQWYGVPFEPRSAPKMKECAALIRRHFAAAAAGGGAIRFDGEFYKIRIPAFSRPYAARTSIPIYFAAVQPGMLRAAGEVADGLFGHMIFTRRYLRDVVWPNLEIGFARAKRSRTGFDLAGNLIVSVSDDREQALAEAKAQIAFYATAKSYEGIFALSGWQERKRAIDEAFRGFDYRKMAACVSDEMVEEIAIVGTPSECRDQLARWRGLIDTPVLYAPVVGVSPERVLENSRRIVETFGQ
ncbi:MAG: LLM class flavin-dependent oxidoreductase [Candidatus Binatia bacterium]